MPPLGYTTFGYGLVFGAGLTTAWILVHILARLVGMQGGCP